MAGDRLVRSVEAARAAEQVVLHFHDGTVDAAVGQAEASAGMAPSPSARPTRKPRDPAHAQQDLFS